MPGWSYFTCFRFIPTDVGNTFSRACQTSRQAVHPHGRGEHLCHCCRHSRRCGSSPRTWGTRKPPSIWVWLIRFIPTDVGNTGFLKPVVLLIAVHPHGRGEHFFNAGQNRMIFGSSPRTWGTPMENPFYWLLARFIPTDVGNTHGFLFRKYW